MAVLTSVFISGMMVLIGRNILSLFVSGEPEQIRQVLDIAYKYLFIMAVFLWILYLLHVYRSAIQGLGNTLIPLASGIAEFVMRVSVAAAEMDRRRGNILCRDLCMEQCSCFTDHKLYDSDAKI